MLHRQATVTRRNSRHRTRGSSGLILLTWVLSAIMQCFFFLQNILTFAQNKYKSCILSVWFEQHIQRFEKKSKCLSQSEAGFSDRPEKHKLGRGRWDLLPVKFRWIPFSEFKGEVDNVSPNQRPGRPSCFSDQPENTNLAEDVEILLPVKFRLIPFSGFRGEVENVSTNQRPGRPSCFSDGLKNTNFVEDVEILLPVQFCWIPFSGFKVHEKSEMSQPNRGLYEILLPVNFVEFRLAVKEEKRKCLNQSEVGEAIFFFRSARKTQTCLGRWDLTYYQHKLGRGRWYLVFCQISLN